MFLGSAILLATILFLVDRNKVWKQFFWIASSLCLAAVFLVGGFFGWAAWQERRAEKAEAAHVSWERYQAQTNDTPKPATTVIPIPAGAVITDWPIVQKKHNRFGNATVEADTAMVWAGSTLITTLNHPTRVMVLGAKDSKYQVRLADGRAGEMDMNEIKKDRAALTPAPADLLPVAH
jgi:hypothetical protein